MAKYTGHFTMNAGKALKGADRLFCRIDDDGMIYVCNGYAVFRMLPFEYAETVQPMTKCDAGNWIIERGEKREAGPADFDLVKLFNDTVHTLAGKPESDLATLQFPGVFPLDRGEMNAFYNPVAGFAAFYNRLYISAFTPGLALMAAGGSSAAVLYAGDDPVGMVLPIRSKPEYVRAVKAYFTDAEQAAPDAGELEALRAELTAAKEYGDAKRAEVEDLYTRNAEQAAELEALRGEAKFTETERAAMRDLIDQQAAELEALRAELDQAQQAAPAPAAAEEAPDMRSAAEIIAARFTALAGVTATIKGAQTGAPVVWLDGETKKHADAIRTAGAKWSTKKRAFYVRVA